MMRFIFMPIYTHNLRILLRIQYARIVPTQLYERGHILMAYYVYMQDSCQRVVLRIMVRILHTQHGTYIAGGRTWHDYCIQGELAHVLQAESVLAQRLHICKNQANQGQGLPFIYSYRGFPSLHQPTKFSQIFLPLHRIIPLSPQKKASKKIFIFFYSIFAHKNLQKTIHKVHSYALKRTRLRVILHFILR